MDQIDHFLCKSSGDCINEKDVCDGDSDCPSNDDESYLDDGPCNAKANNCTFKGESGFVCDGNRCLRKQVVCDGIAQCKDGSDEHFERCAVSSCPPNNFQCKQSKQCIPKGFVCDGHADCRDKSDEMENCTECPEFRCNNGLCIQYEKVCDGTDLHLHFT